MDTSTTHSEELYRRLVESVKDYAIFTLDPEGNVTSWNTGAQKIKGYRADEIIGRNFGRFYPEESRLDGRPGKALEAAIKKGRFEEENWRIRKDGSHFWASVTITPLFDDLGQHLGFTKVVRDMTSRKQYEETLHRNAETIALLEKVATAANQASNLEEAVQITLRQVCTYTGWDLGHAYILDHDGSDELVPLRTWAAAGDRSLNDFQKASDRLRFSPGSGLPGAALKEGKPLWVEDILKDPNFPRYQLVKDNNLRSVLAFPVFSGKKVVSVLEFFSATPSQPSSELIDVMSNIATQLGRVIERREAEKALRQSEARFRKIFQGSVIGIVLMDIHGRLLESNPAILQMFGYSDTEMMDIINSEGDHPAYIMGNPVLFKQLISGERDEYFLEKPYIRKDGGVIWGRLWVTLIRNEDNRPHLAVGMLEDITSRKQMEAELAELQYRLMEGREADRFQLAKELHEGPVQDLFGISYHLKAFADNLPSQVDHHQLDTLQELLQQVARKLRRISGELRPPSLSPFGLEKAIESHAEIFQEANAGLALHLNLMPDGLLWPERVRLGLFRIYQQALENIVEHSKAKNVWVRLIYDAEELIMEIEDDGEGFNVPNRWIEMARQGQLGLVDARERADAFGGDLAVHSTPGQGTTIRVRIPGSSLKVGSEAD